MYTTSACVNLMHCQLPGTKASQDAACSSSQLARVHVDAWPSWHNWPPGIAVWMHYSSVCDALPAPGQRYIVWCSLFTLSGGKGEGEQAAPCDALVHGSWQCITHAEVVYILESRQQPKPSGLMHAHGDRWLCAICARQATHASKCPGGKGTRRWMSWLAQMTPRHRRVDALGSRVCIACCSCVHFA